MTEHRIEYVVSEWQLPTVGSSKGEVAAAHCGSIAAAQGQIVAVNIDTDDATVWHGLGDAHRNRCLTAPEIQHDHVRMEMGKKEVRVYGCAASYDGSFDPGFLLCFAHCTRW